MGLLSVPSDPVPAWAKIDLQLHQPYRTFLGFGRLRCDWCGEAWGRHGCRMRESAARVFVYIASPAQKTAALDSGDITTDDLRLRRSSPTRHRHRRGPSSHRQTSTSPHPHPRTSANPHTRRAPSTHPFAVLGLADLAAAIR